MEKKKQRRSSTGGQSIRLSEAQLAAVRKLSFCHCTISEIASVIEVTERSVYNAVQAMKLGAIDFLAKPLRPEELRQLVGVIILRHESNAHVEERDDFERHITEAKKLINVRDFPAASNHIERALELESRSPEAFNLAGGLAEMMEDYDRAKRLYGEAIKINKRYEPTQQNMRRIFDLYNFGSSEEPFNLGNK